MRMLCNIPNKMKDRYSTAKYNVVSRESSRRDPNGLNRTVILQQK